MEFTSLHSYLDELLTECVEDGRLIIGYSRREYDVLCNVLPERVEEINAVYLNAILVCFVGSIVIVAKASPVLFPSFPEVPVATTTSAMTADFSARILLCIFIASIVNNERRKQKDVARAADLTEVTIRSRYKEMAQFLNIDIHI